MNLQSLPAPVRECVEQADAMREAISFYMDGGDFAPIGRASQKYNAARAALEAAPDVMWTPEKFEEYAGRCNRRLGKSGHIDNIYTCWFRVGREINASIPECSQSTCPRLTEASNA